MDNKMKKAISPILSAVLLIAFVVAIAGISSQFFNNFMKDRQSEISDKGSTTVDCTTAHFVVDPDTVYRNNDILSFTLNVKGSSDLDEFYVTLYNESKYSVQSTNITSEESYSPGDNVFLQLNLTEEGINTPIVRIDVDNPTCSGVSSSLENDTDRGWVEAQLSDRFENI